MKDRIIKNRYQIFAEEGGEGGEGGQNNEPKTFTQEELDEMLKKREDELGEMFDKKFAKKFAEYKAKAEKDAEEAAKLANMNATQKAEHERDELQKQIDEYKAKEARSKMVKEARTMFTDKGLTLSDALVEKLVSEDAEATKSTVDDFASLFQNELDKAVKAKLAGEPPKTGSSASKLTKKEIMAIKDPVERQKLIAENFELF